MGVSRTSNPAFVVSFSGLVEMANWVTCSDLYDSVSVLVSKKNNELVNIPLFSHDPRPDCPLLITITRCSEKVTFIK